MKAILQLIRLPNLIIVVLTQCLIRYCVIEPFLRVNNFELQFSDFSFLLLVLSTVLITAAGYTINDYFDTKTDRLNKPKKVVIDKVISRESAIKAHTVMNILGVGLGVWLAFRIKVPGLGLIFFLAAGILWFYSTNYKRQFLIGNILVSVLTAMVPMLVVLFELPLVIKEYGEIMLEAGGNFNYIFYWVSGFSFFAFITTLIREIIKDTEDFEGDSAYGMNTLPIFLGVKITKIVIIALVLAFNLFLYFVLDKYILNTASGKDSFSLIYFAVLILIPSLMIIGLVALAKDKVNYKRASTLMKIIMLAGLFYSFVVYYSVLYRLN